MTSLTIPAAQLGDANDQRPARALWEYGRSVNWYSSQRGLVSLPITFERWSIPVWDGTKARGRTIFVHPSPGLVGEAFRWQSVGEWPVKIPWGSDFRTGLGTDSACIIFDGDLRWEAQNLRPSNLFDWVQSFGRIKPGHWVADMLHRVSPGCVEKETHIGSAIGRLTDLDGLLTADQAANGVTTALALGTFNAQFGPPTMARPPRFVAPATRIEHTAITSRPSYLPAGDDPRMIPRGTRFRLSMTDLEIETWALRYAGMKFHTAIIVATGLRDYGFVDSLTVGADPYLQCEGVLNPSVRSVWNAIGIRTERDARTLLDGLITESNLKVVNAA